MTAEDVFLVISIVNIIVLAIIITLSMKGYMILRDRSTGLLSLAFILFLVGETIMPLFIQLTAGWDHDDYFFCLIFSLFTSWAAFLILFYAFYRNKNYNQIIIKKWQFFVFIVSASVVSLAMIIFLPEHFFLGFETRFVSITMGIGSLAVSISLLLLLIVLIKHYKRSRNVNTLSIIMGFFCLFLTYSLPGLLLVFWLVNSVFHHDMVYSGAYVITDGIVKLIGFLSFLNVLIRTRVAE